jgi:dihydroneopterin aldolase
MMKTDDVQRVLDYRKCAAIVRRHAAQYHSQGAAKLALEAAATSLEHLADDTEQGNPGAEGGNGTREV